MSGWARAKHEHRRPLVGCAVTNNCKEPTTCDHSHRDMPWPETAVICCCISKAKLVRPCLSTLECSPLGEGCFAQCRCCLLSFLAIWSRMVRARADYEANS